MTCVVSTGGLGDSQAVEAGSGGSTFFGAAGVAPIGVPGTSEVRVSTASAARLEASRVRAGVGS